MFTIACLATGSGCGMGENACKEHREGGEEQVSSCLNWYLKSGSCFWILSFIATVSYNDCTLVFRWRQSWLVVIAFTIVWTAVKDTYYTGLWCWFQANLPSSATDERKNAGDGSQSHCCSCDASMTILDSGSSITFALRILVSCVCHQYRSFRFILLTIIWMVDAELCKVLHTRRKDGGVRRAPTTLFVPCKGQVCASYCDQNAG